MTIKTALLRFFSFALGLGVGVLGVLYLRSETIDFLPIVFSHDMPLATTTSDTNTQLTEGGETGALSDVVATPGTPGTPDADTETPDTTSANETTTAASGQPQQTNTAPAQPQTEQYADAAPSSDQLRVETQHPGLSVVVSHATIGPNGGWLVVRDFRNNTPGSILGARRVLSGSLDTIEVSLLRAMVSGSSYIVQVYSDDGNNSFDIGVDIPVPDRKPVQFSVE